MPPLVLALLIGIVAGMRTMTAPMAVSWAAAAGWLPLEGTWLGWMGWWGTPWIFTLLAIGEVVADKLPTTPSRKAPPGFIGRLLSGALCGAAIGLVASALPLCIAAGVLGAVIGTLGGHAARMRLSRAFGADLPAALIEDLAAIALGAFAVASL
ncbi:membrane protein [Sphingomonas elodea]|uniref:membrane protein n=1 Tax=Sphingomonas elodea TaxID=179878 RepID=UPI0004954700|nr:membrane protein [Sphingomonas elodea]